MGLDDILGAPCDLMCMSFVYRDIVPNDSPGDPGRHAISARASGDPTRDEAERVPAGSIAAARRRLRARAAGRRRHGRGGRAGRTHRAGATGRHRDRRCGRGGQMSRWWRGCWASCGRTGGRRRRSGAGRRARRSTTARGPLPRARPPCARRRAEPHSACMHRHIHMDAHTDTYMHIPHIVLRSLSCVTQRRSCVCRVGAPGLRLCPAYITDG